MYLRGGVRRRAKLVTPGTRSVTDGLGLRAAHAVAAGSRACHQLRIGVRGWAVGRVAGSRRKAARLCVTAFATAVAYSSVMTVPASGPGRRAATPVRYMATYARAGGGEYTRKTFAAPDLTQATVQAAAMADPGYAAVAVGEEEHTVDLDRATVYEYKMARRPPGSQLPRPQGLAGGQDCEPEMGP